MCNAVVRAFIHGMLFESEDPAEPFDSFGRKAITQKSRDRASCTCLVRHRAAPYLNLNAPILRVSGSDFKLNRSCLAALAIPVIELRAFGGTTR
jgi:hypothetical protein